MRDSHFLLYKYCSTVPPSANNSFFSNYTLSYTRKIMVATVASKEEFQSALQHSGLVVVDFFATWCGPCKMIAPLLDKFSNEYSSAKFIKVDVDELSEVAQEYEVSSMPTILFFKDGKVVEKVVGANPAALKQALGNHA